MDKISLIPKFLLEKRQEDLRYKDSVFEEYKKLPPKEKGATNEAINDHIFSKLNYKVEKRKNTDHDHIYNGVKYEAKGPTLVRGKDFFSILQIRPNQDYDYLLLSLYYPNKLVHLRLSKEKVLKCIEKNLFKKQHGGNSGDGLTFCFYGTEKQILDLGAEYFGEETYKPES